MSMVIFIVAGVILLFGLVVLRGAPYLPTLAKQQAAALDLLDLKAGQTLLELGFGDGRLLARAAERGITSVGYELNPLLVLWAKIRYWKYRHLMTLNWGDYWLASWPKTDALYVFLLDPFMERLDNKIIQYIGENNYKVASYTFQIPNKTPKRTKDGVYLYVYNQS